MTRGNHVTAMEGAGGLPWPAPSVGVLGPVMARPPSHAPSGAWDLPPTRQVGRLLATLAAWPGQAVDPGVIVQALWGETPPVTVRNTLQVHASHLRRWLGKETIRHRDDGYLLDIDPDAVDAHQFTRLVQSATRKRREQDTVGAIADARAAVDLVRGPAFADLLEPELVGRRSRIGELADQMRLDLVEWRLEAARDSHDVSAVVADAREIVARSPLRETGYALLMRALYAAGRGAEAQQVYDDAARYLKAEHRLQPGVELTETRRRCQENDPSLLPAALRPSSD